MILLSSIKFCNPRRRREKRGPSEGTECVFPPYNSLFLFHSHTESAALCGGSGDRRVAWVVWTRTDLFFMDLRN